MKLYLLEFKLWKKGEREPLNIKQLVRGDSPFEADRKMRERLHFHLDASKCEFCGRPAGFESPFESYSAQSFTVIDENFHSYTGEIK